MEQENKFWSNEVHVGTGNLKQFRQEYSELSAKQGQFVTASHIFPIMSNGYSLRDEKDNIMYEWTIYFKRDPNQGKTINKQSGMIENKGTLSNPLTNEDFKELVI